MDFFILLKLTPPALFLLFLSFSSPVSSVFFKYPNITSDLRHCPEGKGGGGICTFNDSYISSSGFELTLDRIDANLTYSVGRAVYANPISLYDPNTLQLTDFITHFTFSIKKVNAQESLDADGMTFFFVPFNESSVPDKSYGGCLGLISNLSTHNEFSQVVGVEFDTFHNNWDPDEGQNVTSHVGIDVGSIRSMTTVDWQYNTTEGKDLNAVISYDSSSLNLSVLLTCTYKDDFCQNLNLSYIIDLRKFLPPEVAVGFSAATGNLTEIHSIKSWEFNSTLKVETGTDTQREEEKEKEMEKEKKEKEKEKKRTAEFASISVAAGVEFVLIILVVFYAWKLRKQKRDLEENVGSHQASHPNDRIEHHSGTQTETSTRVRTPEPSSSNNDPRVVPPLHSSHSGTQTETSTPVRTAEPSSSNNDLQVVPPRHSSHSGTQTETSTQY